MDTRRGVLRKYRDRAMLRGIITADELVAEGKGRLKDKREVQERRCFGVQNPSFAPMHNLLSNFELLPYLLIALIKCIGTIGSRMKSLITVIVKWGSQRYRRKRVA